MDPDATLAIAIDRDRPMNERMAAVYDLRGWLAHGGFPPDATYPHEAAVRTLRLAETIGWEDDLRVAMEDIDAETPPPSK